MKKATAAVAMEEILTYAFMRMDAEPEDAELVMWAEACKAAYVGLMSSVCDNGVRERALAEHDEMTADCIRNVSEVLEALEAGELVIEKKHLS